MSIVTLPIIITENDIAYIRTPGHIVNDLEIKDVQMVQIIENFVKIQNYPFQLILCNRVKEPFSQSLIDKDALLILVHFIRPLSNGNLQMTIEIMDRVKLKYLNKDTTGYVVMKDNEFENEEILKSMFEETMRMFNLLKQSSPISFSIKKDSESFNNYISANSLKLITELHKSKGSSISFEKFNELSLGNNLIIRLNAIRDEVKRLLRVSSLFVN